MPTGYTAPIEEDPSFSVEDFVKRSLRGMGACVHQRDESLDVPPSPPSRSSIRRARQKLEEEQQRAEYRRAQLKSHGREEYEKYVAKLQETRDRYDREERVKTRRYNTFTQAIKDWDAPEGLEEFQRFMLQQLEVSTPAHRASRDWYRPEPYEDWLAGELESLDRNIEWAESDYEKSKERYARSRAYITKVYEEWGLEPDWNDE